MTVSAVLLRAMLLVAALLPSTARAHEGHDPAGRTATPRKADTASRLHATSQTYELVARLQDGELEIYLDRFESNAPVIGARITVDTPSGAFSAKLRDGTYRVPAPWALAGTHKLVVTVVARGQTETLAGTLVVPASNAALREDGSEESAWARWRNGSSGGLLFAVLAFAAGWAAARLRSGRAKATALLIAIAAGLLAPVQAKAHDGHEPTASQTASPGPGDMAERQPDGALYVPKAMQRVLSIRTVPAQSSAHARIVELPGRVIPDPNASGFVQAAVSGRLSAPPGGFPRLGAVVKAGDLLAFVTPPFQAIDVSDMRQKAGELDQQITIVARRITRYEPLAKIGAVPNVLLDEAVLELKGLKERRSALDKVRVEPERLLAPVAGVVASANAAAGQIAETNAVVFQIVDPARLWVEALSFSLLPEAMAATARTADGRQLTLAFQGSGLADRSQALPVHFAIEDSPKGLRIGELVTVLAPAGEAVQGIAVARAALVRGFNGQTILFEHAGPERFEPKVVRVEPLDAARVLVLDGLKPGARVVVQGAELLNQIR